MVIVLPTQTAVIPAGKFDATPIPVAPVVVWVISVNAVLIHKVGVVEAALTVLFAFTVTCLVTMAENPSHPVAVTCISTVPEKPFAQVMTPVEVLITPAALSLNDQLKPVLFVAVVA